MTRSPKKPNPVPSIDSTAKDSGLTPQIHHGTPTQPGTSRGMQKIKRLRTVDCLVGRVILKGDAVSHLLLGLYNDAGLLNFIGPAPLKAAEGKRLAGQISKLIEPPGFTGKQPGEARTQFGHRMGEWRPLAPKLVAEVQYDHFTAGRFRHGARFLRWRPDKAAGRCTVYQVQSVVQA
jgi:ATP-dependent DNA ligase